MKATIQLDEALLSEAKEYAARTGKSLSAVIEDALWQTLAHEDRPVQRRKSVKLTTVSGRGLQPGVDLDNSSALLSLMERDDDPS